MVALLVTWWLDDRDRWGGVKSLAFSILDLGCGHFLLGLVGVFVDVG